MLGDSWGCTPDELARTFPCDAFEPAPTLTAFRGVGVHARTDAVWPWAGQVRPR